MEVRRAITKDLPNKTLAHTLEEPQGTLGFSTFDGFHLQRFKHTSEIRLCIYIRRHLPWRWSRCSRTLHLLRQHRSCEIVRRIKRTKQSKSHIACRGLFLLWVILLRAWYSESKVAADRPFPTLLVNFVKLSLSPNTVFLTKLAAPFITVSGTS